MDGVLRYADRVFDGEPYMCSFMWEKLLVLFEETQDKGEVYFLRFSLDVWVGWDVTFARPTDKFRPIVPLVTSITFISNL